MRKEVNNLKRFNTIAVCIPSKHYMVDLTEQVKEIKKLVDAGKYFYTLRSTDRLWIGSRKKMEENNSFCI